MVRVVAVVGATSSGKSTLVRRLVAECGWPVLSIDEERRRGGGWFSLVAKARRIERPTFIESVLVPASYRSALALHDARSIVVTCDGPTRVQRMLDRGTYEGDRFRVPPITPRRFVSTTEPVSGRELRDLLAWMVA